jgi:hypothetical protein
MAETITAYSDYTVFPLVCNLSYGIRRHMPCGVYYNEAPSYATVTEK